MPEITIGALALALSAAIFLLIRSRRRARDLAATNAALLEQLRRNSEALQQELTKAWQVRDKMRAERDGTLVQYPPPDTPPFCQSTSRGPRRGNLEPLRRALAAAAWLLLIASLLGCQQTPLYRLPANKTGYRLPPCSAAVTPGTPCAPHVVESKISACEKRFGKKLCDQGKPRAAE